MLKVLHTQTKKNVKSIINLCCCHFSDNVNNKVAPPVSDKSPDKKEQSSAPSEKSLEASTPTKKDLVWRNPWHESQYAYHDTLRTLYSSDSNLTLLQWLQKPIDFSPTGIKNWWLRGVDQYETKMQEYIPERHGILGPELACAHFIVHRGGAVKFHGEDKWIKAVDGEYQLPNRYQKGMYLQAIDCTDVALRYEGLENLRNLRDVEWLSLHGCQHMDDFCMDVITNIFSHSLRYLDIRDCFGITERGLGALYKIPELKILYVDDMLKDTRYELTCLLLEQLNPGLRIKSDVITFEIK